MDGIGAPGKSKAVTRQALSVLVVDDNTPDVVLIRESLNENRLDHTITHCANGREALDILEKGQPHAYDVMILDLNMPKVGGLEVLAKLRKMPEMESLPVLVLTSSLAPDEQAQAMRLGADRFLRKPADLDRFLNDVGAAVRELTQSTRVLKGQ